MGCLFSRCFRKSSAADDDDDAADLKTEGHVTIRNLRSDGNGSSPVVAINHRNVREDGNNGISAANNRTSIENENAILHEEESNGRSFTAVSASQRQQQEDFAIRPQSTSSTFKPILKVNSASIVNQEQKFATEESTESTESNLVQENQWQPEEACILRTSSRSSSASVSAASTSSTSSHDSVEINNLVASNLGKRSNVTDSMRVEGGSRVQSVIADSMRVELGKSVNMVEESEGKSNMVSNASFEMEMLPEDDEEVVVEDNNAMYEVDIIPSLSLQEELGSCHSSDLGIENVVGMRLCIPDEELGILEGYDDDDEEEEEAERGEGDVVRHLTSVALTDIDEEEMTDDDHKTTSSDTGCQMDHDDSGGSSAGKGNNGSARLTFPPEEEGKINHAFSADEGSKEADKRTWSFDSEHDLTILNNSLDEDPVSSSDGGGGFGGSQLVSSHLQAQLYDELIQRLGSDEELKSRGFAETAEENCVRKDKKGEKRNRKLVVSAPPSDAQEVRPINVELHGSANKRSSFFTQIVPIEENEKF